MKFIGLLIVVVAIIFTAFRAVKTHFICPKCGSNFKISAFIYLFSFHAMSRRMVKCPNCGNYQLMRPEWDKK